jgi:hypothetical protein
MPDARDFESNAEAARFYTSLGVAIPPSHHSIPLPVGASTAAASTPARATTMTVPVPPAIPSVP